MQNKNHQAAKETLLGATQAPPAEEAARQIDDLVAMPVDEDELVAQADESRRIPNINISFLLLPDRLLRLRMQALDLRAPRDQVEQ